jgi:hypothetical protein
LPPTSAARVTFLSIAFRLDPSPNDLDKVRPVLGNFIGIVLGHKTRGPTLRLVRLAHRCPGLDAGNPPERSIEKIDHIAMMLLFGIVVDLLAADIGKNPGCVAPVFNYQPSHRSKVLCLAFPRGEIVEGKAHPEQERAREGLPSIGD